MKNRIPTAVDTKPLLGGLLAVLLALAAPARAHQVEKRFPVTERPLITIRNAHGKIRVQSWSQPEVRVVATHPSNKVEVDAEQIGNRIEITTHRLSEDLNPSEWVADYQITVPEETELQVHTDSGDIYVERVFGDMNFDTVTANLELREVAGYLVIKTIGGSLVCIRCAGRLDFRSISGSIRLLEPMTSNLYAQTSSGSIFFDGEFLRGGMYRLQNSSGPIEVRFSESNSFELSAKSVFGRVESNTDLRPRAHSPEAFTAPRGARRMLSGIHNEGHAKVELVSFSGTITIRKRD